MLIKVQFLNKYNSVEDETEYFYRGYENAEVGDIVVANTRYGYGIAIVSTVNAVLSDSRFNEYSLKSITTVVKSMASIRQEEERKAQIKHLAERVKREKALATIKVMVGGDEEILNFVEGMNDEEMQSFISYLS